MTIPRHEMPPINDPLAPGQVRRIDDADVVKNITGHMAPLDTRDEATKAADKARKEFEDNEQATRKEASRKAQADAETRADELIDSRDRVFATRVATRGDSFPRVKEWTPQHSLRCLDSRLELVSTG